MPYSVIPVLNMWPIPELQNKYWQTSQRNVSKLQWKINLTLKNINNCIINSSRTRSLNKLHWLRKKKKNNASADCVIVSLLKCWCLQGCTSENYNMLCYRQVNLNNYEYCIAKLVSWIQQKCQEIFICHDTELWLFLIAY